MSKRAHTFFVIFWALNMIFAFWYYFKVGPEKFAQDMMLYLIQISIWTPLVEHWIGLHTSAVHKQMKEGMQNDSDSGTDRQDENEGS